MKKAFSMILVLVLLLTSMSGFAVEGTGEVESSSPEYSVVMDNNFEVEVVKMFESVSIPVSISKDGTLMTEEEVLADPNLHLYVTKDFEDGTNEICFAVDEYADGSVELSLMTLDYYGYSFNIEGPGAKLLASAKIRFNRPEASEYDVAVETNLYEIQTNDSVTQLSIPVEISKNGDVMTEDEVLSDVNLDLYVIQDFENEVSQPFIDISNYENGKIEFMVPSQCFGYTLVIERPGENKDAQVQIRFSRIAEVKPAAITISSEMDSYELGTEVSPAELTLPFDFFKDGVLMTDEEVLNDSAISFNLISQCDGEEFKDAGDIEKSLYVNGELHLQLSTDEIIGYMVDARYYTQEQTEIESIWIQLPGNARDLSNDRIEFDQEKYIFEKSDSIVDLDVPVRFYRDGVRMTDAEVLENAMASIRLDKYDLEGNWMSSEDITDYHEGIVHLELSMAGVLYYELSGELGNGFEYPVESVSIQNGEDALSMPITRIESDQWIYQFDGEADEIVYNIPLRFYDGDRLLSEAEVLDNENIVIDLDCELLDGTYKNISSISTYADGVVTLNLTPANVKAYYINAWSDNGVDSVYKTITIQRHNSEWVANEVTLDEDPIIVTQESGMVDLEIPVAFLKDGVQLTDEEVIGSPAIEMSLLQAVSATEYEYVKEIETYSEGRVHLSLSAVKGAKYLLDVSVVNGEDRINKVVEILMPQKELPVTEIRMPQVNFTYTDEQAEVRAEVPVLFYDGDRVLSDEEVNQNEMIRIYYVGDKEGSVVGVYDSVEYDGGVARFTILPDKMDSCSLMIEVSNGIDTISESAFFELETEHIHGYAVEYYCDYIMAGDKIYLEQSESVAIKLIEDETGKDVTNLHNLSVEFINTESSAPGAEVSFENKSIRFSPITDEAGYVRGTWILTVDGHAQAEQNYLRYRGSLGQIQIVDPAGQPVIGNMNLYFASVNDKGALCRNFSNHTTENGYLFFPVDTERENIQVYGFSITSRNEEVSLANSRFVNVTSELTENESVIDFGKISLQPPHYTAKVVDESGMPLQGSLQGDLYATYTDPTTGISFPVIARAFGNNGELAFSNIFDYKMPPYKTDELLIQSIDQPIEYRIEDVVFPLEATTVTIGNQNTKLSGNILTPSGNSVDPSLEFRVYVQAVGNEAEKIEVTCGANYEILGLKPGQYCVWVETENDWQKQGNLVLMNAEPVVIDCKLGESMIVDLHLSSPNVTGTLAMGGESIPNGDLAIHLVNAEGNSVDDCLLLGSEFYLRAFDLVDEGDYVVEITAASQDVQYESQQYPVRLVAGEMVDLGAIECKEEEADFTTCDLFEVSKIQMTEGKTLSVAEIIAESALAEFSETARIEIWSGQEQVSDQQLSETNITSSELAVGDYVLIVRNESETRRIPLKVTAKKTSGGGGGVPFIPAPVVEPQAPSVEDALAALDGTDSAWGELAEVFTQSAETASVEDVEKMVLQIAQHEEFQKRLQDMNIAQAHEATACLQAGIDLVMMQRAAEMKPSEGLTQDHIREAVDFREQVLAAADAVRLMFCMTVQVEGQEGTLDLDSETSRRLNDQQLKLKAVAEEWSFTLDPAEWENGGEIRYAQREDAEVVAAIDLKTKLNRRFNAALAYDLSHFEGKKRDLRIQKLDLETGVWQPMKSWIVSGHLTCEIEETGSYRVVEEAPSFTDIQGHWAEDVIARMNARGYVQGKSETEFAPDAVVNRAEFVTMLMNTLDQKLKESAGFLDVQAEDWFYEAVNLAAELGITKGDGAGNFEPYQEVTREDLVLMLTRFYEMQSEGKMQSTKRAFYDMGMASGYAKEAINGASEAGVLTGVENGYFHPKNPATRADALSMIERVVDLLW